MEHDGNIVSNGIVQICGPYSDDQNKNSSPGKSSATAIVFKMKCTIYNSVDST